MYREVIVMSAFVYQHLELLVSFIAAGCIPFFVVAKSKSNLKNSNDITRLIVKNKKLSESINKQSKSIF